MCGEASAINDGLSDTSERLKMATRGSKYPAVKVELAIKMYGGGSILTPTLMISALVGCTWSA
jgi:hypothetical protein